MNVFLLSLVVKIASTGGRLSIQSTPLTVEGIAYAMLIAFAEHLMLTLISVVCSSKIPRR